MWIPGISPGSIPDPGIGPRGLSQVPQMISALFLITLLLLELVSVGLGFNVDTLNVISHRGPSASMFGFSVAQHRDSNVSWILVGAPEADSRQSGVRRGGAVFRCSCESSDTCQLVPFDRTGNNVVANQEIDEKSNQWFGATVKSSGDDGIILACAPRYTWFTSNRKRRDPVGTCFVAKDSFTEFVEYSPCRTTKWGYHRQGSCQVGLGADVDPAGRRLFLGAVGSWYWQGQLYSSSSTLRPDIRWTQEGPSSDDDSYLGYSVASGEFSGDQEADVAVGMPRGANLAGKVVIYSSELVNLHNITGEQMGAYFGYSLTVLDVDGDGLDDIVIGAPLYTDYQDTAMKIETGRVYVVYQNKRHKFKRWDSLDGTAHRGRFGLSLTSLGDINRDGIDDFAVGAPYDGLYGRGAVYIFQGTQDGVRKESTQVIHASAIQHSVSTFGFSLSGGRDLDGNGYPDLIVGAYDSDVVGLFRSRPVVRVRSKLTFTSGKQINLDDKKCTLRDGRTRVPCFPLSLCMSYDGFGADDVIDFNVEYLLDSKKTKEQRMFFLNNEGLHSWNSTVRLRKTVEQCSNSQVYIRSLIRDKLTPLEAELRYSMVEGRTRHLAPVIDLTGSTTERDSVSIRKDCGPDNVCVPDLRLRVYPSDASFVIGSTERIWVDAEVYNNGEDSFESTLFITVPHGLSYDNAEALDTRKDVIVRCDPPSPSSNNTVVCEMGNPLPAFAKAKVRVFFQTRHGTEVKSSYEFLISVNSTNPEEGIRRGDNFDRISIPIAVKTELKVFGIADPQPVPYNVSSYRGLTKVNETHIGPEVLHTYEVKCMGPSGIEEATVVILWPSFTAEGDHFLYLLEEPKIDGPATCEPINTVNPLGIKIQRKTDYRAIATSTTVQEGEGRRTNFTSSSELITEGGTYTQTYQNSSIETSRKTQVGGGGRGQFSSTHQGQGGRPFSTGGNIGDSEEFGTHRSGSSTTTLTSGRSQGRPTSTSTDFHSSLDSSSRSGFDFIHGGGGFETQETSYRGGMAGSGNRNPPPTPSPYVPRFGERGYRGGETTTESHRTFVYVPDPVREDRTYTTTSGINQGRPTGGTGTSRTQTWRETQSSFTTNGRGHSTTNGRGRGGEDHVSFENGSEENYLDRQKRSPGEDVVPCGIAKCTRIRCRIGPMSSDSSVTFYLRGRVYADTLEKRFPGSTVELSSKLRTEVTQLPYNVSPGIIQAKELSLVTTVEEEVDLSVPPPIPWWVYLIAIIAGILFLLLLIFLLAKCGFFKRRRPNSSPEGQPLHRNGYSQDRM